MRKDLQNKINDAICCGVKLGLDLYDDEIQDISLDKDLLTVLQQKAFKEFDPFKHITDKIAEDFINGDKKYLWLFKELCCNYCDDYYRAHIIKNNRGFLCKLIIKLCSTFGNSINLNWIDVSNIKDMSYLFEKSNFNGDISQWDVSNVEHMHCMFLNSKFTGDISKWDVSNVRDMSHMFKYSHFNGDISAWNVNRVKSMGWMFANSKFNGDLSKWNVSNVWDMNGMFENSKFNRDISQWNIKLPISAINTFENCNIKNEFMPKPFL